MVNMFATVLSSLLINPSRWEQGFTTVKKNLSICDSYQMKKIIIQFYSFVVSALCPRSTVSSWSSALMAPSSTSWGRGRTRCRRCDWSTGRSRLRPEWNTFTITKSFTEISRVQSMFKIHLYVFESNIQWNGFNVMLKLGEIKKGLVQEEIVLSTWNL